MSLVSLPMEQNLVWTFEHINNEQMNLSFGWFLGYLQGLKFEPVLGSSSPRLGIWTLHQKSKEKIKELVLNL